MAEAAAPQKAAEQVEIEITPEMKRPHGAFVTQVYANEIGGFCTPAKEKLLAAQHAKKTGVLLRYSWEIEGIDGGVRQWEKRLDTFLRANPHGPRRRLSMTKEQARKALVRMERTYAHREFPKREDQRKPAREDFRYMNDLRSVLGLDEHDYEESGVPQASQEAQKVFEELQEIVEPDARIAAVRVLNNPDVLRLLILGDPYAAVRELAERRYGEFMVVRR